MTAARRIELVEYGKACLGSDELPEPLAKVLWRDYRNQVAVEPPSFKNGHQWILVAHGWVGYIPVDRDWGILLQPKAPLATLFRMLEYAYRLKSFRFLEGLTELSSVEDFYQRLAMILAKRTLDRFKKGLYRAYLPQSEQLPFVRGAIDVPKMALRPWTVRLPCDYQDHTGDVVENQILAWTLQVVAHSGACSPEVSSVVRKAFRTLHGLATPRPFRPRDCIGRPYNRLNQDYGPLHALCRFFLEQTGPTHETGDRRMLPFLVDMARLFELFVAEWLKVHLPADYLVKAQEGVRFGDANSLRFDIDLVLYKASTCQPLCVLDTKYKVPAGASADDVAQVVAYAESKGCRDAYLIYPKTLTHPLDTRVGKIHVRTIAFHLDGPLESAGNSFLETLLGILEAG